MTAARFRFYEELNDFLPAERRKRTFACRCARAATVKHAIEALGVPHTEVELILVDGTSVDFSYRIQSGDRIAVYPTFESFDISTLLRVRPAPLRDVRFIADVHVGRLARHLRLLGFDTIFEPTLGDAEIARRAAEEHRVILTRDRGLLMRRIVTHGCLVRATEPRRQVEEILDRLQLHGRARPFTRCTRCNHPIEAVNRDSIAHRLEPDTARHYAKFHRCPGCDRIYWEGSHHRKMVQFVERVLERAGHEDARLR